MSTKNHLISSNYIQVANLNLHYLAAGDGKPVILLHGWPTSSYLWRNIIEPLSRTRRVIAPDLPGFGKSDKPLSSVYTLTYLSEVIGEFLDALNIENAEFVLHDLGVAIGLLWIVRNPERTDKIVITNSLVYPDGIAKLYFTYKISLLRRILMTVPYPNTPLFMKMLLLGVRIVGFRRLIFSAWPGVQMIMKLGVKNKKSMSKEVLKEYMDPFKGANGHLILKKTFLEGTLDELEQVVDKLQSLKMPVHIIYGEDDWLIPLRRTENVRLQQDLPNASLTAVPNCGHFIQEDQPEILTQFLVEVLAD